MTRKLFVVSGVVTVMTSVAIVVTAPIAVAATPRNGTFAQIKNNRELMRLGVTKGHVSDAVHYDKCVVVPILTYDPKIKVTGGKFSWTHKVTDVIGQTWRVHVDGNFVTRNKATGHWSAKKLTGTTCTSTYAYTVTRQANA